MHIYDRERIKRVKDKIPLANIPFCMSGPASGAQALTAFLWL
jgi:hypothetical protein